MIKLIWAMDKNNLIGKDNDLPWHYKEDLQYFKKQTLNKDVLMGYNTFISIVNRLNKPLPKRNNYVLAEQIIKEYDVVTVTNLTEFIKEYQNTEKELFVIGGKSVYEQLLDVAQYLYITYIDKEYSGNVYFKEIDYSKYDLINEEVIEELKFRVYKKKE